MLTGVCQRWRDHRSLYRPAGEPIRPAEFGIEEIAIRDARSFIERTHYSRSMPACRLTVGLHRSRPGCRSELVGVAAFSVPMTNHAIPAYSGLPAAQGVELGRLVILDECEANAESYFLARAFNILSGRLPEVGVVLSYSDPVPRRTATGVLLKAGHVGTCYQGLNARFVGRSKARKLVIASDGTVVSERSLSKLRNDESGAEGTYRSLIAAGAPAIRRGENIREYVKRALTEGPFVSLAHPGNFAYLFAIGDRKKRHKASLGFRPSLPYPKLHSWTFQES